MMEKKNSKSGIDGMTDGDDLKCDGFSFSVTVGLLKFLDTGVIRSIVPKPSLKYSANKDKWKSAGITVYQP